ncbi:hypothetical protein C2S52_019984 [Perilla frutescens var. hirtella]|nr:hypothetical protein C2S52_019984 [Perilla frutescens var. hirtella]
MGCCGDDDDDEAPPQPLPLLISPPSDLLQPLYSSTSPSSSAADTTISPMNSNFSALLCKDTLRTILQKLSLSDLARSACVSRLWRSVASDGEMQIRAFISPWKLRDIVGKPSSSGFWRDNSLSKFAVSHRLSRSDSIASLAVKYSVQVMDIKRLNNMMSEHGIYSRERLLIPINNPKMLVDSTCYIEVDAHAKREVAVLYLEGAPDRNLNALLTRLTTERGKRRVIDSLKRSMHVDDSTAQYYLSLSNGDPRAALTRFSEDLRWERQIKSGMEDEEEVVIVGAGIAGLATSLGLHRLGIRSLVVESADSLRSSGYALGIWKNGWRALDVIGIGDLLRQKHHKLTGIVTTSVDSGINTSELPFRAIHTQDDLEFGFVNRRVLLETLENELPRGSIRYCSKVVHIESEGRVKSVHLADGTVLKTKVLIGCDGVNSVVSRFLGFSKPSYAGRSAVKGLLIFEDGHDFEPKFMQFFGKGVRFGVVPCDDYGVYWGFTFTPSSQEKEMLEDPSKLKNLVLSKLGKVPDMIRQVFERSEVENMVCAPLRYRRPWELLWGNISKDNVCVLGDALHPMTPDLGQGGCSALEESVVLARLLAEALKGNGEDNEEHRRIQKALERFARERRWRSFDLIATAYIVGFMQQNEGGVMLQQG